METKSIGLACFEPQSFADLTRLGEMAARSRLFAVQSPEAAVVMMLTGASLGLPPVTALRGIHVVQGRAVLSSDLLVAVVLRSGQCDLWRPVEVTAERCTLETRRRGHSDPIRHTWTMEMARKASLTGKAGPWQQFPAAMLRARCSAELARMVYPDVLFGVYVEGEIDEEVAQPAQPAAITREAFAAMDASAQVAEAAEVRALAPTPAAQPKKSTLDDVRESAAARHTVRELADLWRSARAEIKAAKADAAGWKIIADRALALGLVPAAVKAEVRRLDDSDRGPGGGGGQKPSPTAREVAAMADYQGVDPSDAAQLRAALAMVPPWCTDFAAMEAHVATYAHPLAVERCARKHRTGLPPAARELLALRYQRLSWDPHDGEVTIESARRLVATWIAQGPVERVRPTARAKIAAGVR